MSLKRFFILKLVLCKTEIIKQNLSNFVFRHVYIFLSSFVNLIPLGYLCFMDRETLSRLLLQVRTKLGHTITHQECGD